VLGKGLAFGRMIQKSALDALGSRYVLEASLILDLSYNVLYMVEGAFVVIKFNQSKKLNSSNFNDLPSEF